MQKRQATTVTGLAASIWVHAAIAGPPMVTDDTGTAAPGMLEIIAFAAGESRDSGDSLRAPAVDLAYGLGETIEISLSIPRQRLEDAGEPSVTGWGEATAGLKWRLLEDDNTAVALAPSLSVPLSTSSTIIGLVEDTTVLTLPLLASVGLGRCEFTGNLGYSISSKSFDAISLSLSTGYALTPDVRLLGEVWGVDFVDDGASDGFLNWRTGIEWAVSARFALLAAFGGEIWSQLESPDQLNHDFYIGIQYNMGK